MENKFKHTEEPLHAEVREFLKSEGYKDEDVYGHTSYWSIVGLLNRFSKSKLDEQKKITTHYKELYEQGVIIITELEKQVNKYEKFD